MSRDDGFAVADVDTAYLADPKIRNLWRALGDENRMARAVLLHEATLLESWRSGVRVTVGESVPLWLAPDPDLIAALQKAHLLDASGRIPTRSWKCWHDPAAARRQILRDRWNRANAKRKNAVLDVAARLPRGDSAATATPDRTDRSGPSVPSGPIGPSSSGARAREETLQGKNGRTTLADLVTPEALAAAGRKS